MNKDLFHGRWKQISGMVKQTWGNRSEQELIEVDGRIERHHSQWCQSSSSMNSRPCVL